MPRLSAVGISGIQAGEDVKLVLAHESATFPTKQQAERWAQAIESLRVREVWLDASTAESTSVATFLSGAANVNEVIVQRENDSSDPQQSANRWHYFVGFDIKLPI